MNVEAQETKPEVSIIYVNWNSADEITESLASLKKVHPACSYEVIIVDNNSPEAPTSLKRDDVRLILNPENKGFGAGCNVGARNALGEYVLFLNPDTIVRNDVVSIMRNFLSEHPDAGACGALLLNEDGSVASGSSRRFPSLLNTILELSSLCFRFPKAPVIGRPYYGTWDHCSTRAVDSVNGGCFMFRKDFFTSLGGFDETFFLYYEEVDLLKRTADRGMKVYSLHTAQVVHLFHKSTEQYYGEKYRILLQHLRSSDIYFKKHHGAFYALLCRLSAGFIYFAKYCLHRRKEDLVFCKWGFFLV